MAEQKWAFVGIFGGALPAALAAIYKFFWGTDFGAIDLVQILFFFIGGSLAIYVHLTNKRLAKSPTDLASEIRARSKRKVQKVLQNEQQQ